MLFVLPGVASQLSERKARKRMSVDCNVLPCVGELKLPKLDCLLTALVGVGTEGAGVPIALVILPMLANTAPRPCVCTAGGALGRSSFFLRELILVNV